ncbi:hypothetical protein NDU88_009217 [Pleurodeles waltl]|uniref:Uncharacterized protein n=1 Tax=Pleurodeles waltl TaxID=8319 RepID=A0AAV7QSC8_PLEWA|nr:hypothetical protein NDU88_009217 [Pleurodeles waltl]
MKSEASVEIGTNKLGRKGLKKCVGGGNFEGTEPWGRYRCEEAGRIQRRRVGSNERQLGGNGDEARSSEVKRRRVTGEKRPLERLRVPGKGRHEGEEKCYRGNNNKAQHCTAETKKERNKQ